MTEWGWARDRLADRRPLLDHHGESGATLELANIDGQNVVVKTFSCERDFGMRATSDTGRAAELVMSGALDRLPPGVDHGVLDAWKDGEDWVQVMRDVSAGLIPATLVPVPTDKIQRIVSAAAGVHASWWGDPPDGVTPFQTRLELMSPVRISTFFADDPNPLVPWILGGWDDFFTLVDDDVAEVVSAIHADTRSLEQRLSRDGITLLHGDLWLENVAVLDDEVVLLDWALATAGSPAMEWAYFLGINWWQMDMSHEDFLEMALRAEGEHLDPQALDIGLLWGLASYGWNKAHHATHNEDPAVREHEADDLAWWVDRARRTLETWQPELTPS